MRLALAAGRLDVDAVLTGMSARQLREWQAYERMEGGFGDRAAWYMVAQLTALHAEMNRDPKRRAAPFSAKDFLPFIERPKQSAAQRLRGQLGHLVQKKKRR